MRRVAAGLAAGLTTTGRSGWPCRVPTLAAVSTALRNHCHGTSTAITHYTAFGYVTDGFAVLDVLVQRHRIRSVSVR